MPTCRYAHSTPDLKVPSQQVNTIQSNVITIGATQQIFKNKEIGSIYPQEFEEITIKYKKQFQSKFNLQGELNKIENNYKDAIISKRIEKDEFII